MLDGKLHLSTPEGVSLVFTPAGPARRGYAWLIDWLLRALIGLVLYIPLLVTLGRAGMGLGLVAFFLLQWAYGVLFEVLGDGRTPGKRMLGLQVLREDGLPVGWRESVLRNVLRAIDFMPLCYGIGLGAMLLDARFRRIGDLVAGTIVVYREQPTPLPKALDVAPVALPFPLTPDEQRTLVDLVERVHAVPPQRQLELGDLAQPLTGLRGQASLDRLYGYVAGLTGKDAA
ncbi:RDD family protein [Chitiniphilus shinanonensis]|uniref:RDD family protein n=1 Tax=Chitiniphilus shinanonensis TaxID=553088 RepID=A0ABQ6BQV9_9NEIS|nr:RDD family protein [Chitiniphilus shinanonensis]GLS04206.1 RDD family protein [Chitiniphilus shinanonensis]